MPTIFKGFDWDDGNRDKNLKKHGINCEEAEEVFLCNPFTYPDDRHSTESEKRYVAFGETRQKKTLLVAFTIRGEKVRVISARPMSQKERGWYETEKKEQII